MLWLTKTIILLLLASTSKPVACKEQSNLRLIRLDNDWNGDLRAAPDLAQKPVANFWDQAMLCYRTVKSVDLELVKQEASHMKLEEGKAVPVVDRYYRSRPPTNFHVKEQPLDDARELFAFTDTTMVFVHTIAGSGTVSCSFQWQCRNIEENSRKLLVFEAKDDWIKIKGKDSPPQNGAFGWMRVSAALAPLEKIEDPLTRRAVLDRVYPGRFLTPAGNIPACLSKTLKKSGLIWAYLRFGVNEHCPSASLGSDLTGWTVIPETQVAQHRPAREKSSVNKIMLRIGFCAMIFAGAMIVILKTHRRPFRFCAGAIALAMLLLVIDSWRYQQALAAKTAFMNSFQAGQTYEYVSGQLDRKHDNFEVLHWSLDGNRINVLLKSTSHGLKLHG